MDDFINNLLEGANDFIHRKPGFLPLVAIGLIVLNFLLHVILGLMGVESWFASSNVLLHLGLVVGLVGILLIRPLE